MNRITEPYAEVIAAGLEALPPGMRDRLGTVDFWTGTDPLWGGLLTEWYAEHPYVPGYKVDAACCYPHHTRDRSVTVVLLAPRDVASVVHELGHALQWRAGLWHHQARPVTAYASSSRAEAFAEALVASLFWYGDQDVLAQDQATVALLERLAA